MRDKEPPNTYPRGGVAPKAIGKDSRTMDTVQELLSTIDALDVQGLLNTINILDQQLSETSSAIEALEEKRKEITEIERGCYKNLYEALSSQKGAYFAVGKWLVIVNRNFPGDVTRAITIQPLVNL